MHCIESLALQGRLQDIAIAEIHILAAVLVHR